VIKRMSVASMWSESSGGRVVFDVSTSLYPCEFVKMLRYDRHLSLAIGSQSPSSAQRDAIFR
jgi:hypothetical protein